MARGPKDLISPAGNDGVAKGLFSKTLVLKKMQKPFVKSLFLVGEGCVEGAIRYIYIFYTSIFGKASISLVFLVTNRVPCSWDVSFMVNLPVPWIAD